MERKSWKNRIFTIITIIFLISSISISGYFLFRKEQLEKKSIRLEKEYKEISNDNAYIEKKNNLEQEINNLNNIESNISKLKIDYFKEIKKLEDEIISGKSNKKIVYLTFDDGPYYKTYDFLDVLDKYNVNATFFTIGLGKEKCLDNRNEDCRKLYKEIVERGNTIANHTYSHLIWNGLYKSPESFITQIKKQEELIKEQTGVVTKIARFPGGSATAGSKKNDIIDLLRKNGYGWIDWTAQDGDGGELSGKDEAWNNFVNSIDSNIEVVLFHDYNDITLQILPKAIEYLQSKGYTILPLFYESNMVNK